MSFNELSIILVAAAGFGAMAKFLKQPILVGFLFAGIILSYFNIIQNHEIFDLLGKIGIALLLFLVGLEMNVRDLKTVGKSALLIGIGQVVITTVAGFGLVVAFGFNIISSLYISLALTFSSTIIIIKLLSEKRDIGSLYGKISVGLLLVQDFIAITILMILSGFKNDSVSFLSVILLFVKTAALFYTVWYLSKDILPKIFSKIIGQSQELLFIVSIAWALGVSTLVGGPLGFSFEIGGFLAGLALSNLPEHFGISSKTKSLRDFFLVLFFLSLGSQLLISGVSSILPTAIFFSIFVLVGNPLIVMIIMGVMGHKSRTSFLAGVTMAQVSEFSFILMAMGKSLGHVSENDVTLVILVGAITMVGSTYLILGAEKIYQKFRSIFKLFELKNTTESVFEMEVKLENHVVLIGCDKIGNLILPYFLKRKIPTVVVDYNPSIFQVLSSSKIDVILGDIIDTEIQDKINIDKARLVICTVPNVEENLSVLARIKNLKEKPIFIGSADNRYDSIRLYEYGADYILNPDIVAGEFLRHVFLNYGLSLSRIVKMGKLNFNRLMYFTK